MRNDSSHTRDLPVRSSTESISETLEVRRQDWYIKSPEEIKPANAEPVYVPSEDEGREPTAYAADVHLITGAHVKEERENQLHKVVLCPPHERCGVCPFTMHIQNNIKKLKRK